ncbi:MAG: hypothetical protein ACR2MZ_03505 [Candidatus Dormibacter sp.]|uniref:hypothetical protein n=1 Tax=Candidatus Dormibacter sp. TaxID=2973982 RepID=UPI003D9B7AF6
MTWKPFPVASRHRTSGGEFARLVTTGVSAGIISSISTATLIVMGSLYVAIIKTNHGAVIGDPSLQVEVVPDSWFGRMPLTSDGSALWPAEERLANQKGYHPCKRDTIHEARYLFQGYACTVANRTDYNGEQSVVFFYDGRWMGPDATLPSRHVEVVDRSGNVITVQYELHHLVPGQQPGTTLAETTGGTAIVHYRLADDDSVAIAQDPIPSRVTALGVGR